MTAEQTPQKNYIILRGIERGNVFFTMYNPDDDYDRTKLVDGTVAYEIVGYAATIREAQIKIYGHSSTDRTD